MAEEKVWVKLTYSDGRYEIHSLEERKVTLEDARTYCWDVVEISREEWAQHQAERERDRAWQARLSAIDPYP